jgi:signal transduction histidine kinase
VPVGPLASFIGSPLVYPATAEPATSDDLQNSLRHALAHFTTPDTRYLSLDPEHGGNAGWAISLWNEQGLIGVLLLGPKRDGGLYTQEEMEVAAASGERLLDTQASAEVARRLVLLQRQRMAESQVLDRQTRRVLHDDVLPTLHAAILALSNGHGVERASEAVGLLTDAHHNISDLLREMPHSTLPTIDRRGLLVALRQVVEDEFPQAFHSVRWHIDPQVEQRLAPLSPLSAEVLFYAAREAIRNAARHGRRADGGPLSVSIRATWQDGLDLRIEDDGVGMGALTLGDGGSGNGLALHSTMMAVIGGSLLAEPREEGGSRVTLTLPQESWHPLGPHAS